MTEKKQLGIQTNTPNNSHNRKKQKKTQLKHLPLKTLYISAMILLQPLG